MASNKREMYAERKGRCEGGEKVGGGGRGGRRDTEIIVLRY